MEIEPTSFIVVAVFVLTVIGVAYGLKTRKGSGISNHPGPDPEDPDPAPGIGSPGEGPPAGDDRPDGDPLDQHGMK